MTSLFINVSVGILFIIIAFFAKKHPNIISGYKSMMQNETNPDTIESVNVFIRNAAIAMGLMVILGTILTYIVGWETGYSLSILIPTLLMTAVIYTGMKLKVKNGSYFPIIAIVCLCILVAGFIFFSMKEVDVNISKDEVKISGIYSTDIALSEITEINLVDKLPSINARTNGFALGKVRMGYFRTSAGRSVKLFTYSEENPCVEITTKDKKVYYINFNDKHKIQALYTDLKKQL